LGTCAPPLYNRRTYYTFMARAFGRIHRGRNERKAYELGYCREEMFEDVAPGLKGVASIAAGYGSVRKHMGIIITSPKPATRFEFQWRLSLFSLSAGVTFTPRLGPRPNLRGLMESSPVAPSTGLVGTARGGVNRPPAFPALLRPKRFLLGLPPSQLLLPVSATLLSAVAGVTALGLLRRA
jgi:hypothetical protein